MNSRLTVKLADVSGVVEQMLKWLVATVSCCIFSAAIADDLVVSQIRHGSGPSNSPVLGALALQPGRADSAAAHKVPDHNTTKVLVAPIPSRAVSPRRRGHLMHKSNFKRITIYGDSQATDLYWGMRQLVGPKQRFELIRRTRGGTGLVRNDQYDWFVRVPDYIKQDRPDIIIVSFGGNDRQSLQFGGRRLRQFSAGWWNEYLRRVNYMMDLLKQSGARVFWLSLPSVRSWQTTLDYRKINAVLATLAQRKGIRFVDGNRLFQTRSGHFKWVATDFKGRQRRLRRADGIHFSSYGAQLLANNVMAEIRQTH